MIPRAVFFFRIFNRLGFVSRAVAFSSWLLGCSVRVLGCSGGFVLPGARSRVPGGTFIFCSLQNSYGKKFREVI